jgi:hypothetical protein
MGRGVVKEKENVRADNKRKGRISSTGMAGFIKF